MTNRSSIPRGRIYLARDAHPTIASALPYLPPVLYAFRLEDDVIKIGWSEHLNQRRKQLRANWADLLAIKPGTIDQERALHRRIPDAHRHHGVEYYLPTPGIIAMLNGWRSAYGLAPIEIKQAA